MTRLRSIIASSCLLASPVVLPAVAWAESDVGVMADVDGVPREIRAFGPRGADAEKDTLGLDMSGAAYAVEAVAVGQGLDAAGDELAGRWLVLAPAEVTQAIQGVSPVSYEPEDPTEDVAAAALAGPRRTVYEPIAMDDGRSGE
jgi:hypothetical protein